MVRIRYQEYRDSKNYVIANCVSPSLTFPQFGIPYNYTANKKFERSKQFHK